MGYQALLFCPDEKLARVVTQVFGELDFTVGPAHEPFSAVKKLMAQRFDAIVVDCENQQNASLLFRSARNSNFNQSSLAIALVEGQAGVAKAYRIGANLVLTKPINVEQAKGTLRVARGLLRKNADAAASAAAISSSPVNREAEAAPAPSRPEPAAFEPALPQIDASAETENSPITIAAEPSVEARQQLSTPAPRPHAATATAAAPAKDLTAPAAFEAASSHGGEPIPSPSSTLGSQGVTAAPPFQSLDLTSFKSGGAKKILIAAVAVLILAALGYFGYGMLRKPAAPAPVPQAVSAPPRLEHPTPAVLPAPAPVDTTSSTTPGPDSSPPETAAPKTPATTPSEKPSHPKASPAATRTTPENHPRNQPARKKPEAAPIVVKSGSARTSKHVQADDSAPPLPAPPAVVSAGDNNLSGVMASAKPSLPQPPQQTLKISQGVTQGLLIKRVSPRYPQSALEAHTEGKVQIEATISKEGTVVNPKVLKGNPVLSRAAIEAVRQWRYKPYTLDGEPVEIQTEITINFKAN